MGSSPLQGATGYQIGPIVVYSFHQRFGHKFLEQIEKGNFSNAQGMTDQIVEWSRANTVFLNRNKCKEMRISFARDPECFDAITIDGKELEVVKNAKLLELTISDNLTWNANVN